MLGNRTSYSLVDDYRSAIDLMEVSEINLRGNSTLCPLESMRLNR